MKISKEELLKALKAVQPGLGKGENTEEATSFVFNKKRVFTYNDEVAVSYPLKTEIKGAVPAKEFFALVQKVNSSDIDLSLTDSELVFKGARAKANFRLEAEIRLPLEQLGMPDKWGKLPDNFNEGIKSCLFTASKELNTGVLTCIHITNEFIESSDNHRITRFDISSKVFKEELLIPATSAKEIVKYNPTEFAVTEGWCHFRNKDGAIFSCRVFEAEYPELDEYLDVSGEELHFPDTTVEILDRASVLSDGERATIEVNDGKLTVRTENSNGKFEEVCRVKFEGELEFDIQPEFLKSIIKLSSIVVVGTNLISFETEDFQHVASILVNKG